MDILDALKITLSLAERAVHPLPKEKDALRVIRQMVENAPNGVILEGFLEFNPYGSWSDVSRGVFVGLEPLAVNSVESVFDKFDKKDVTIIAVKKAIDFDTAYSMWFKDCLEEYNEKFEEERLYTSIPEVDYEPGQVVEFSEDGDAYPHGNGGTNHIARAVTPWKDSKHFME